MRIGEVAAAAGVNIETLRYYERRGLLAEPDRSGVGYRSYPADAVEAVRFIKRAQRLGFSLAEIAELRALTTEPDTCAAASSLAAAKIAELDGRIAELATIRASLEALVSICRAPHTDPEC